MTDPELEARAEAYAADRLKDREYPLAYLKTEALMLSGAYLDGALVERELCRPGFLLQQNYELREQRAALMEDNARLRDEAAENVNELEGEIDRLKGELDASQAERNEEARLNGMGSEREARLMAQVERLRAALEAIDQMAHPHDKVRAIARDALGDAK